MKRIITIVLAFALAVPGLAQQYILHPWAGKKVAYLGDSIIDPRNDGSKVKCWNYLEQWLGITPYVYGISGRQWNDIPRQAEQLRTEHGDDVDAIIIFIGTNDYNSGVPIGQWYVEKPEKVVAGIHEPKHPVDRIRRYPSTDASTFRGRINIAMDALKRMYPTKQIVLLTPLHRAGFYAGDSNWQPTEDYTNLCGEFLDAYVESVKEAGNVWAVPVIDWNASSGLYPMSDDQAIYFKDSEVDRLHPNDAGHARLARTLMYQLLTLPCTFD